MFSERATRIILTWYHNAREICKHARGTCCALADTIFFAMYALRSIDGDCAAVVS
jgi:hypothetical protein